jgi:hypothetical protein
VCCPSALSLFFFFFSGHIEREEEEEEEEKKNISLFFFQFPLETKKKDGNQVCLLFIEKDFTYLMLI